MGRRDKAVAKHAGIIPLGKTIEEVLTDQNIGLHLGVINYDTDTVQLKLCPIYHMFHFTAGNHLLETLWDSPSTRNGHFIIKYPQESCPPCLLGHTCSAHQQLGSHRLRSGDVIC